VKSFAHSAHAVTIMLAKKMLKPRKLTKRSGAVEKEVMPSSASPTILVKEYFEAPDRRRVRSRTGLFRASGSSADNRHSIDASPAFVRIGRRHWRDGPRKRRFREDCTTPVSVAPAGTLPLGWA
jgi:hypothetical protein